jgi:hypothetical protein
MRNTEELDKDKVRDPRYPERRRTGRPGKVPRVYIRRRPFLVAAV